MSLIHHTKPRGRQLGLPFVGRTGPNNAITDVAGLEVGYFTRIDDASRVENGKGPARTGVTAIFPCGRARPDRSVWAGQFSLNGNGEMTGSHWIHDAGYFTGPIALTNSHSVGMVHHGLTRWMIQHVSNMREHHHWYLPVVAETYDGLTNDITALHVAEADVLAALDSAKSGAVDEGNVGGGTGMQCYEFKGGTGTSSRTVVVDDTEYSVGVLVQANFGIREEFSLLGVPVGRFWPEDAILTQAGQSESGSVIVIIATDAPLHPVQLQRLARRGALGIGRTGTTGGVNSGDIMLAFTTNDNRLWNPAELVHGNNVKTASYLEDNLVDVISRAAAHATEEAVINAMLAAQDMSCIKPDGLTLRAIDSARLLDILKRYRPLSGLEGV
ncbi:P1 family peptidase [Burkholderia sp. Ac-20353]|uniref:P1 family peptidase n=1 Tax=Burkholderia sp. Ac-20353 TaxID=2703894 RepID=UPI00197B16F2|nr:P1 family peptidase [Burkholderia sp. Ac-20353]MBN3786973.1 S58 family peptidase [Burkholderia sp. Ac-20353]